MTEPANLIEGLMPLEHYEHELTALLNLEFPSHYNKSLEDLHKEALAELDNDNLQELIPKIIQIYVDSSSEPLSQLSQKIMKKLCDLHEKFLVNSEEVAGYIHKIATRKNYGKKNKRQYEDTEKSSLWCWELFNYKQPGFVIRERNLIGALVKSLDKLISEMKKEPMKNINECFSNYNKQRFAYEKFRTEQNERKRKKETDKEEKEKKITEKVEKKKTEEEVKKLEKQKIEERKNEEKKKRLEEINKKKEENKRKEEERKKLEEERKKKMEEEKRRKEEEEKKKKEDPNTKKIHHYFLKESPSKSPLKDLKQDPHTSNFPISSLTLSDLFSSNPIRIPRINSFIYFTESHLKPYFLGELKQKLNTGMLQKYGIFDYERDSEEDYEEIHGEDIDNMNEEDEEDSASATELEEIEKFIVKDGYLSADEKGEEEEVPVVCISLNQEIPPMQVYYTGSEELDKLQAFCLNSSNLPILVPKKQETVEKEQKPLKMVIDDNLAKEVLTLADGKFSKDEIIEAVKSKYPLLSKQSIKTVIKNRMKKLKNGSKCYKIQENN